MVGCVSEACPKKYPCIPNAMTQGTLDSPLILPHFLHFSHYTRRASPARGVSVAHRLHLEVSDLKVWGMYEICW